VTYGNGQFVTVGDFGTILASPDATTWTIKNSGTTEYLRSVTFGDSQFVAVGDGGSILTSKADNLGVIKSNSYRTNITKAQIIVANNRVFVSLPNATTAGQLKVEIFTVAGKRTYSSMVRINNGILNIPTLEFASGIYFMMIKEDSRSVFSSKIVLTR
jgi:hypothetical protein